MWIEKIVTESTERKNLEEAEWARWRVQVADFRNANRGKGDAAIKPREIIELSFDKENQQEQEKTGISFKEAKALLGGRIKHG